MLIREAEPVDACAIAQVKVAAWRGTYVGLLPATLLDNLSVCETATRWADRISRSTGQVLVCEQRRRIVGFAFFRSSGDDDADPKRVAELCAMYVTPGEWRKGCGTALMDEIIHRMQEQGYSEATLWVLHNNEHGQRFYDAMGFVADGAKKVVQRDDGVNMRVVRYRRLIGSRDP